MEFVTIGMAKLETQFRESLDTVASDQRRMHEQLVQVQLGHAKAQEEAKAVTAELAEVREQQRADTQAMQAQLAEVFAAVKGGAPQGSEAAPSPQGRRAASGARPAAPQGSGAVRPRAAAASSSPGPVSSGPQGAPTAPATARGSDEPAVLVLWLEKVTGEHMEEVWSDILEAFPESLAGIAAPIFPKFAQSFGVCLPTLAGARAFEREATQEGFEYTPDGEATSVKLRFQVVKGASAKAKGVALQPYYDALKTQVPAFAAAPFSEQYRPVEKTALGFKRSAGRVTMLLELTFTWTPDGSVALQVETLPALQDNPDAVAAVAAVGGLPCRS